MLGSVLLLGERPEPDAQPAAVHPEGIENVGMGVVQGGWEYVYAAYGVGLLGVVLYAVSLVVRTKESKT